jgi:hypothetical protein
MSVAFLVSIAAGTRRSSKDTTMIALLLLPLILFASLFSFMGRGFWGGGFWGPRFWGRPMGFRRNGFHHHGFHHHGRR